MNTPLIVPLLDHGYLRLANYTQPAREHVMDAQGYDGWTGDLEIVRAARVSHNADWRTGADEGKDAKLIEYLWKNRHTSPFEAMSFSFEIQAPIFVFRQWHRHRTQSYNEVSARYTELPDLFYIPDPKNVGQQSSKNKQVRVLMESGAQDPNAEAFCEFVRLHSEETYAEYKSFLELGIPRELARLVLPVNIYSRMYATANLLNWFRFISLRADKHAQYEIRIYADAMISMIEAVCPIAMKVFLETQNG